MQQRNTETLQNFENRLADIGPVEPSPDYLARGHRALDSAGMAAGGGRLSRYLFGAAAAGVLAVLGFVSVPVPEAVSPTLDLSQTAALYSQFSPHETAVADTAVIVAAETGLAVSGAAASGSFEQRYISQCQSCHLSPDSGAPRIESALRMREAIIDHLQRSGVCESCSDSHVQQAMDAWLLVQEVG